MDYPEWDAAEWKEWGEIFERRSRLAQDWLALLPGMCGENNAPGITPNDRLPAELLLLDSEAFGAFFLWQPRIVEAERSSAIFESNLFAVAQHDRQRWVTAGDPSRDIPLGTLIELTAHGAAAIFLLSLSQRIGPLVVDNCGEYSDPARENPGGWVAENIETVREVFAALEIDRSELRRLILRMQRECAVSAGAGSIQANGKAGKGSTGKDDAADRKKRDRWIYEQSVKGTAYKTIRLGLSDYPEWDQPDSTTRVWQIAREYAVRNQLPPPSSRQERN